MKRIILSILLSFLFAVAYAQQNPDSLAYQLQRKKINAMLEQRSQKFDQYNQSMNQHTGIFGLQTKKDIRRSNDILMDIAKTDNDLYDQIKILLNMRTFQQAQALDKSKESETKSKEIEAYNLSFMNAVNKLRAEKEILQQQLADADKKQEKTTVAFIMVIVLMLVSILLLLRSKYKAKM